jgi:hypothetical protein
MFKDKPKKAVPAEGTKKKPEEEKTCLEEIDL